MRAAFRAMMRRLGWVPRAVAGPSSLVLDQNQIAGAGDNIWLQAESGDIIEIQYTGRGFTYVAVGRMALDGKNNVGLGSMEAPQ